jgi:hypothetical protein
MGEKSNYFICIPGWAAQIWFSRTRQLPRRPRSGTSSLIAGTYPAPPLLGFSRGGARPGDCCSTGLAAPARRLRKARYKSSALLGGLLLRVGSGVEQKVSRYACREQGASAGVPLVIETTLHGLRSSVLAGTHPVLLPAAWQTPAFRSKGRDQPPASSPKGWRRGLL